MVKKYYCEHCDKTFPDDARKKHLTGQIHQQNVRAHYDQFRGRYQTQVLPDLRPTLIPASQGRFNIPRLGTSSSSGSAGLRSRSTKTKRKLQQQQLSRQCETDEMAGELDVGPAAAALLGDDEESQAERVVNKRTTAYYLRHVFPASIKTKKSLPPSLRPPPVKGYDWDRVSRWG